MVGSIEVGKHADVVLWDEHPLERLCKASADVRGRSQVF
jgi:imidazolonepropionase-like amidohydrolase